MLTIVWRVQRKSINHRCKDDNSVENIELESGRRDLIDGLDRDNIQFVFRSRAYIRHDQFGVINSYAEDELTGKGNLFFVDESRRMVAYVLVYIGLVSSHFWRVIEFAWFSIRNQARLIYYFVFRNVLIMLQVTNFCFWSNAMYNISACNGLVSRANDRPDKAMIGVATDHHDGGW